LQEREKILKKEEKAERKRTKIIKKAEKLEKKEAY